MSKLEQFSVQDRVCYAEDISLQCTAHPFDATNLSPAAPLLTATGT